MRRSSVRGRDERRRDLRDGCCAAALRFIDVVDACTDVSDESEETEGAAVILGVYELQILQRTQAINDLRNLRMECPHRVVQFEC